MWLLSIRFIGSLNFKIKTENRTKLGQFRLIRFGFESNQTKHQSWILEGASSSTKPGLQNLGAKYFYFIFIMQVGVNIYY